MDYIIDTVRCEDVEMKYLKFGSGSRKMVILPGVAVKSVLLSAEEIVQHFSSFCNNYTVYLFDRRLNMPDTYLISEMADDTSLIMKSLGIEEAYFFGFSQGGIIAQFMAIRHPELVRAAVLVSTTSRINELVEGVFNKWLSIALSGDRLALGAAFAEDIFSKETNEQYGDFLKTLYLDATDNDLQRFVTQVLACLQEETEPYLNEIRCPVLVVGAREDSVFGDVESEYLSSKLRSSIIIYSKFGHAVSDETPDVHIKTKEFFENGNI